MADTKTYTGFFESLTNPEERIGVDDAVTVTISQRPLIRAKILDKAKKCVCGQREQDYGSPEDNFATIAELRTSYLGTEVTPLDVSLMMILLKVARIKTGTATLDSFIDIAGYAACGGEIAEKLRE